MADICIICASEDLPIAQKLHAFLSLQWETWLGHEDIVGDFAKEIETEIPKAGCLVPLFSFSSRENSNVTDELRLGKKHDKIFLPVKIDDSDAPYGYGNLSRIDMRGWEGEIDHLGFKQLQRKIGGIVPAKKKPLRPQKAIVNDKVLLPTVFMSISSHETQLKPYEALQALRIFGTKAILISAYDLVSRRKPQPIIDELKTYRDNGGFVLVDSGNYEKSRLGSKRWAPADLKEVLDQTPHDCTFCFDIMKPKHSPERAISEIINAVERDRMFTKKPVLPIVHAPKLKKGGYLLEHIPQIVHDVSEKLESPLIAVPERELGAGIIARVKTVRLIRDELNKLPYYQPLHLLGTGNPWSIPLFVAAGADTFDGLEWCRMAVDRAKYRLHHFQHFDFFTYQTELADSPITRDALVDPSINFAGKVAFHNLDFYESFMSEMREFISEDNLEAFVAGFTGAEIVKQLKKEVPRLFK